MGHFDLWYEWSKIKSLLRKGDAIFNLKAKEILKPIPKKFWKWIGETLKLTNWGESSLEEMETLLKIYGEYLTVSIKKSTWR